MRRDAAQGARSVVWRGLFQATITAVPITSAGRFSPRGPLGIRLSLPKEGGRAIGEYDQHNHKHAPDDYERNIHLAMISPWGLFD